MPQEQKKFFVYIIVLLTFLVGISLNCYAPAFPEIAKDLKADNIYIQLIIPMGFFSYSIGFFCLGTIADNFGCKKVIKYSLLCFVISCIWQAGATNITSLLLAHFVQGFAVAAPDVMGKVMLSDKYSGKSLAKMFSYVTFAWIGSQIIGPPLGAYVQSFFGWRYIFLFMAILGIIGIITTKYLPETKQHLAAWDFKKNINVYKTILFSGIFWQLSLCRSLGYSTLVVFNIVGPFIVQQGMHKSAIAYGNMVFVFGIFSLLGAILNRFMLNFLSVTNTILSGCITMMIFAGLFLGISIFHKINFYEMLFLLIPIFVARSITTSNCIVPILNKFSSYTGITNALSGSFLVIMGTLVSTLTTIANTSSVLHLGIIYFVIIFLATLSYLSYYLKTDSLI